MQIDMPGDDAALWDWIATLNSASRLALLTKALAKRAPSTEMDVHLDEERIGEAPEGQNQAPNRRNGRSQKTVTTDSGQGVLDIPNERNGTFDPLLIPRYQRRFPEFARKIVSMYARGMTTRESEPLMRH